jgi:hypothetical protein
MMFDMSVLVKGQSQLQEGAEPDAKPRKIKVPSLPEDPVALANAVAAELNVQPEVKQELLEAPSALQRLQREAEILADETPQMQERLDQQVRRRFTSFGMSS